MNETISSLMSNVLSFMTGFVPAAMWGALCYVVILRTKGETQAMVRDLSLFLMSLAAVLLFLVGVVIENILALLWYLAIIMLPILWCAPAALFERKVVGNQLSFWKVLGQLLLVTYLNTAIGIVTILILKWMKLLPNSPQQLQGPGLGAGFLFSPSAISVFRWIIHSSKLRPGLDVASEHEKA